MPATYSNAWRARKAAEDAFLTEQAWSSLPALKMPANIVHLQQPALAALSA
jgi:hypothetical protein